jgi:cell division protein FtsZ
MTRLSTALRSRTELLFFRLAISAGVVALLALAATMFLQHGVNEVVVFATVCLIAAVLPFSEMVHRPTLRLAPQAGARPEAASPRGFLLRIGVVGVGQAGGLAVERLLAAEATGAIELVGVAIDSDVAALARLKAPTKVLIGEKRREGRGTSGDPDEGRLAAMEDVDRLCDALAGVDATIIVAGLGGGVGTGAAPVIAQVASQLRRDALVVGAVTLPLRLEGTVATRNAVAGLLVLRECCAAVFETSHEQVLSALTADTPMAEVYAHGARHLQGLVDTLNDWMAPAGFGASAGTGELSRVLQELGNRRGAASIGVGVGEGPRRTMEAARQALLGSILGPLDLRASRVVLLTLRAPADVAVGEVSELRKFLAEHVAFDAEVLFRVVYDDAMGPAVRVGVIAIGTRQALANAMEEEQAAPSPAVDISGWRKKKPM